MAKPEDQDLDQEEQDEELDEDESTEDEESEEESTDESKRPDSKVDKRISDLQSQLDKEKARANKLEKLVGKGAGTDEGGKPGDKDPERAALVQELREASLDAVFGEFPELKTYGIDRTLVEGTTRAEMRENATSLVALIKNVETKARNAALREHGIKAEPAGSTRKPPKSYDQMTPEEFEKEIARGKGAETSLYG